MSGTVSALVGSKQIDGLLERARSEKQSKQRDERFRKNNNYER